MTIATANYDLTPQEKKFVGWHLILAISALSVGSLFGPLQAFEHAGWDLYPYLQPVFKSYYQGLTIHGVLNALVWTTAFITGFLTLTTIRGLQRSLRYPKLNYTGFWVMVVGVLVTAVPLLANNASVLYTFYPPMKADWLFYVGLTLVVIGSWIEGYGFYFTMAAWRKEHPGETYPFIALASSVTMAMWQIATLGVAIEILTLLLPWAWGMVGGIDIQLARTYFWFTGHPLVYFWLLPAYLSWYAMLPKQAGGKLFSDSMARLVFWLFLLTSVPVGFHHQYVDPGVPDSWKFIHSILTYSVAFPSMLTAFTVIAGLEYAGRKRGGKGLFGWIKALPWDDPSVVSQLLAGILFFFGGIGGITNASYNVNLVIHNTAWVPGHFHLTVSSAATLSFMGITYWLVPYLTGRKLWKPKWALIQAWMWFIGMLIFSNAMHVLGLLGAPRRTPLGEAPYVPAEWNGHLLRVGIGGAILFVAVYLYIFIIAKTAFGGEKASESEQVTIPVAEPLHASPIPAWMDTFKPWLIGAVLLVVIAYAPVLIDLITHAVGSPGFRVW
ncbi:MAG TPA: cytochrome C oxidase subunit I [Chloroflexi bacterium]|nr:cytochrome C oxidase subunit I [Chloroflexota bacterium]